MSKGFTLIELLMVVMVLVILAGLATPIYSGVVSRARESEGWMFLGGIRASALRYYTENDAEFTANIALLDIDNTTTTLFNYCLSGGTGGVDIVAMPQAPCGGCRRLCLDEAGTPSTEAGCPAC